MIAHLTIAHPRDDSRILSKEVATLARELDEPVRLYVQDGLGDEEDGRGFLIVDTGPRLGRLARMSLGGWRMFRAVLKARPKVAHFHDPELLPWALPLRLRGIKVVYDVHEDVPRQVARNPRLPGWARLLVPPIASVVEWVGGFFLDGVVAATPTIAVRFPPEKTVLVRNFPLLHELHQPSAVPMRERPVEFTYVGTISEDRNIYAMIKAVAQVPDASVGLRLAGGFSAPECFERAKAMPEWVSTRFEGWMSREGVASVLADSRAGLVVLQPIEHEMVTLPIKLFEYMAAGLPVISSDFPLWREIVEGADCGLLVDPTDLNAIVGAMKWILDHPDEAERMGVNGRRAIEQQYFWDLEAASLLSLYRGRLLATGDRQQPILYSET